MEVERVAAAVERWQADAATPARGPTIRVAPRLIESDRVDVDVNRAPTRDEGKTFPKRQGPRGRWALAAFFPTLRHSNPRARSVLKVSFAAVLAGLKKLLQR